MARHSLVRNQRIDLFVESFARSSNGKSPTLMLFVGQKHRFLQLLRHDWYTTLPEYMTEEFTDSFEIKFTTDIGELLKLIAEHQCSYVTIIVWDLVSFLLSGEQFGFRTVHYMDQTIYSLFSILSTSSNVIFGESSLDACLQDSNSSIDLLRGLTFPATTYSVKMAKSVRTGSTIEEPGLTGIAIKGSEKDKLNVGDVVKRWFVI